MPIDFDALRGERGAAGIPEDGPHMARLDKARIIDTRDGTKMKTDWADMNTGMWWECWDNLEGTFFLDRTRALLDGLGIDIAPMRTMDDLDRALSNAEGRVFHVRTDTQAGRNGDRFFTHVNDVALADARDMPAPVWSRDAAQAATAERIAREHTQMPLGASDVPVGEQDYAPPAEPVDDDDIPF